MAIFVGLMSGTSMDGVDGVLVRFDQGVPHTLAFAHHPFIDTLRAELHALQQPQPNELRLAMLAANHIANAYADVVHELLAQAQVHARDVRAIGAHGQTVRHAPHEHYTVQLLNAARLAERTGISVVHDFRSRDIAAGGQGAPLVPAFHATLLAEHGRTHVVCNLGGIANITVLAADGHVAGHDTGPANCLMDAWAAQHLGQPFDAHGEWAAGGSVHAALLSEMLAEPYFALAPPKSTGRDLFNRAWLDAHLAKHPFIAPRDVQATLAELTAACSSMPPMRSRCGCAAAARSTATLLRGSARCSHPCRCKAPPRAACPSTMWRPSHSHGWPCATCCACPATCPPPPARKPSAYSAAIRRTKTNLSKPLM
jgi:anhydro-N-acetylmuramic acid kinase